MSQQVSEYLENHAHAVRALGEISEKIEQAGAMLVEALTNGGKILVMGNGGSAADAQHLVAELVGRFETERRGLPALALTTDSSILTAVSNDFGYDQVFSRQVEALGQAGDVVIGISTSGNSANVLNAVRLASEKGCRTIGLLGRDGGEIVGHVDLALTIPVQQTPHIQEAHGIIVHLVCQMVDEALSGS